MRIGFEFEAAKPKGEDYPEDKPYAESMRGDRKILSNPSTDQKKVRRAQQRKTSRADARPGGESMNFRQKESALLRAMASAQSLREQAILAEELEKLRSARTAALQRDKDIEWADTVISETLTPVRSGVGHTAASDWLDQVAPQNTNDAHTQMMAEASVWYNRVSPEVKEDREEFTIQAQGMARRLAGQFGDGAPQAARAFLDYTDFLHQREAASTLDQVEEIRDPKDNPKTTPLPQDTFDTFAEPLAPGNQPGKPSTDNPLIQEILSENGEGGGRPSEHDEGNDLSNHYGPPPVQNGNSSRQASKGVDDDPFGFLASRSVALSYTGSLDDWRERLAKEAEGFAPYTGPDPRQMGRTGDSCVQCGGHIPNVTPHSGGRFCSHCSTANQPGAGGGQAGGVPGSSRNMRPSEMLPPSMNSKTAGGSSASPNDAPPAKEPQKCQKCGNDFTAPSNVHSGYCSKCRDVGKKDGGSFKVQDKNKYDTQASDSKKASYEVVGRYTVEGASSLMPAGPAHADNKDNPVHQGWETTDVDPAFPDEALPDRQTTHPGNDGGGSAEGGGGRPSQHDEGPGFMEGKDVRISKKDPDGDELPDRRTKKERQDDYGAKSEEDDDNEKKMAALAARIRRFADMYGASDSEHKVVGDQREGENTEHNNQPKKAKDVENNGDMPSGAKDPKHKGGEGRPSQHNKTSTVTPSDETPQGQASPSAPATNPTNVPQTPGTPPGQGAAPGQTPIPDNNQNQMNTTSSIDYRKGYHFAQKWTSDRPLVSLGSEALEIGLYDGIKANSTGNRAAWVAKHTAQSGKFPYLAERLVNHARHTSMLRSAATDSDLNTISPGSFPSETGNTPLSGPGRKPPLQGRETSEQEGSPAPYNGAPPHGTSVVPGVNQTPPTSGPDDTPARQKSLYETPGHQNTNPQTPSLTSQQLAFRQRVQASLLTETEME